MKSTNKSINMSSFFGSVFIETPRNMINLLGEPHFTAGHKTNMEWKMETSDGAVFTIYDYKNYGGISMDQDVAWHIGGFSEEDTRQACDELRIARINH